MNDRNEASYGAGEESNYVGSLRISNLLSRLSESSGTVEQLENPILATTCQQCFYKQDGYDSCEESIDKVGLNNPLRRNTASGSQNKAVRSDSGVYARSVRFSSTDSNGLRERVRKTKSTGHAISK